MPQLNPEFFASQLFWLILTFSFLFIFLWRFSLPRISSVLKKRENKINDGIKEAKKLQAEAEKVQQEIDSKLHQTKSETADMIKNAVIDLQNHNSKRIEEIDNELNKKLEESSIVIEEKKNESIKQIHEQIYEITKLTISKVSNIQVTDNEIKETINIIQKKVLH